MANKAPHPGYLLVNLQTFEDVAVSLEHARLLLAALQAQQVHKAQPKQSSVVSRVGENLGRWTSGRWH